MKTVLQLDVTGTPQKWITPHEAASFLCEGDVAWSLGDTVAVLRGGVSRKTGLLSTMEIPSIIATKGVARINQLEVVPSLTRHNDKLFQRDRHVCAYCGQVFHKDHLTREHIVPQSKGGKDTWTNVVTACGPCNHRKAARTPEQANMPLLYLPYAPNRFEDFLLQRGGKVILADQMEFLLAKVPSTSRLHLS